MDLRELLIHFRDFLSKQSDVAVEIDSNVIEYIKSIKNKIADIEKLTESAEQYDLLQTARKIYVAELLSLKTCPKILAYSEFQGIFILLNTIEDNLHLESTFAEKPLFARDVCFASFELLSSSITSDFLADKYPNELVPHVSFIIRRITYRISSTIECIVFKKDDLQNQIPTLVLIVEFINRNILIIKRGDLYGTMRSLLEFIWTLVDDTILVSPFLQTKCVDYALKWISNGDLSLEFQFTILNLIYNIARHDQGVQTLNNDNCVDTIKEFRERVLKPQKDSNSEPYVEMRLLYCMTVSLLTEPKSNQEDLASLRRILDQLMQLSVDCGQSVNEKCRGFHVSEPIVVLMKLCVHDDILKYVLNESSVKNMEASSRTEFFCNLLIKYRGALASDNDLDQLSLIALFNILWSISFHDEYIDTLKSNTKFLMTVKTLANDTGESCVQQYVPRHMSSLAKAANGILWNLDEDNPVVLARAARATTTAAAPELKKAVNNDGKDTGKMRIMISYAHADSDFCHQLVEALQKDKRFDIWVDFAYCHTEDLWEEIGEAIEQSNIVLFLMSKDYQNSKSCRQEVTYAKDSLKKRFIPIYIKKDFVATSWLGIRIVGPQYIRFGKKSFEETAKELINLIIEDNKQEPKQNITTKPSEKPVPSTSEHKPAKTVDQNIKPIENVNVIKNGKQITKPLQQWTKQDILQWFHDNNIHQELIDLYDFHFGTDLLVYGQCLQPDWENEYHAMSERYEQKYSEKLYRDQFSRLVGAIRRLEQVPPSKSKLCTIL